MRLSLFNDFDAKAKIARIVAKVVAPYLHNLRPPEADRSHASSKKSGASSSVSRRKRIDVNASAAASRSSRSRSPSADPSAPLLRPQTMNSTHCSLVFDGRQIHRIGWGDTAYDVTDPQDLIGLFLGYIKPGVRGGIDSEIVVDGQKVKISSDPILKDAYERADRAKNQERETVHNERGDQGQLASVALASQAAKAARKKRIVIE